MLPFTPINSRDTKPTIRGFENSNFTTPQPTDFPVFDPKLFSMGAQSSSQQEHFLISQSEIKKCRHRNSQSEFIMDHQKEHKNIDRGFMSQRNYEQETSERLNGFSIIPRDTRHDTTKKTVEQQISPITNRTTGIPFNKI
jgi:hypothetical protein